MKRTATTFVLLAGLGGGCTSTDSSLAPGAAPFNRATPGTAIPGVVGPTGEPVQAGVERGQMPSDKPAKVVQADVNGRTPDAPAKATSGFSRIMGRRSAYVGGVAGGCADGNCGDGSAGQGGGGGNPYAAGPMYSHLGAITGRNGILPPSGMGPAGAVAFVPPGGGMPGGPIYQNQRTSVRFANPAGMKVTWQGPAGGFVEPAPFEAPAVYNFAQGAAFRLKLSGIPNRPGRVFYPTLEVYHATPKSVAYLSHSSVPLSFTDEDLEQVQAGNMVVKVIYLPDAAFQDLAVVGGADEVVSTRLEPGADPVAEANRRGTILAVVKIGNIDLENPNTPAMGTPAMGGMMAPAAPASVPAAPSLAPPLSAPPASLPPAAAPVPMPAPAARPLSSRPISLPAPPLPGIK